MPINLFYELNKYEDISYADPSGRKMGGRVPQHVGKEICHHSNGNKLHKMQESAASAVGDKHQAGVGGKSATQISSFKMCLMARAY